MESDSNDSDLRERIEQLKAENERLREENETLRERLDPNPPGPSSAEAESLSWGSLTRRTALVGVLGSVGAALFAGSAAAAPSGSFPSPTSDPLLKFRVDRINYVTRSSQPTTPGSGRVTEYVDGSDLP